MGMTLLDFGAVAGLGLIAFGMFFMAFKNRESENFTWFEVLFATGNLFLLACLFTIYLGLQAASLSFADVVFPLFAAVMWIYFIICLVIMFKVLKLVLLGLRYRKPEAG